MTTGETDNCTSENGNVDRLKDAFDRAQRKLDLQEQIAQRLLEIAQKRLGRVPMNFIIFSAPELADLPAEAIHYALDEVWAEETGDNLCLAIFWEPARRYCMTHGLPDPNDRHRLPAGFDLRAWLPKSGERVN